MTLLYKQYKIYSQEDQFLSLAAIMFLIFQTMALCGLNCNHWLRSYLTACVKNHGKAPDNLSWVNPRLCRGDSQSLTFTGIYESLTNKWTAQSLQVRRLSMNDFRSLSHTKWDCKYHLIWIGQRLFRINSRSRWRYYPKIHQKTGRSR